MKKTAPESNFSKVAGLESATLSEKDFDTSAFLSYLRNFEYQFVYRIPAGDCLRIH